MFIYPRCHSHICGSASHSPIDVVSLWFSRTKKGMWVTIGTDQQLSTRTWYALMFLSLQHLILFSLTTVNMTYHLWCSTLLSSWQQLTFLKIFVADASFTSSTLRPTCMWRWCFEGDHTILKDMSRPQITGSIIQKRSYIWLLYMLNLNLVYQTSRDNFQTFSWWCFLSHFFLARQKNAEAVGNHSASLTFSPGFSCNYIHNRMPPLTYKPFCFMLSPLNPT